MIKQNRLYGGRVIEKEFQIPSFAANVPQGTKLSDVLDPFYWLNYHEALTPGCEVCVLSEDYELDVVLRVLKVDRLRIDVRVMTIHHEPKSKNKSKDNAQKPPRPDGLSIKWGGSKYKFMVVKDGERIEHGFSNKQDAEKYIDTAVA